jgi:glycosyltransferase involved in cell wall biosynthesis
MAQPTTTEMKQLIATYHYGFAGGSKNTSRLLNYLAKKEFAVDSFFFETPQYFKYTESDVKIHSGNDSKINSEVINVQQLASYALAEDIIAEARKHPDSIFFAANLFPYCNLLHEVKSIMIDSGERNPKLIIHPVGSDIWQIGTHMKHRVKWLIDSPLIDHVITYSQQFVEEIKTYYGVTRDILVLPPVLETSVFFPLSQIEKLNRRRFVGFTGEDFIIHHHSSMRKVKCPEVIVEIAVKAALVIDRKVKLIMVGPIPEEVISEKGWLLTEARSDYFKYVTVINNLVIYWTGILSDVSFLMQMADIELNSSLHDSFNIALMEAMGCGIPVVTSDVVGIAEHIINAGGGYCFNAKKIDFTELNAAVNHGKNLSTFFDINQAVELLDSLATNTEVAKQKGKAGAKYVIGEFNAEKVVEKFKQMIS